MLKISQHIAALAFAGCILHVFPAIAALNLFFQHEYSLNKKGNLKGYALSPGGFFIARIQEKANTNRFSFDGGVDILDSVSGIVVNQLNPEMSPSMVKWHPAHVIEAREELSSLSKFWQIQEDGSISSVDEEVIPSEAYSDAHTKYQVEIVEGKVVIFLHKQQVKVLACSKNRKFVAARVAESEDQKHLIAISDQFSVHVYRMQ